ncbi:MAG TPA: hypothetical protein VFI64_00350 [Nitrososphaeraceae archaeon]|nr:hypothetical protein [Nitrososphaeraceae archaeon]
MKKIILPLILVFVTLICTPNLQNAVAHTFSPVESASFLSLVDQIKSTLLPIKEDISSNVTQAREQAQYAKLLLNESVLKELKERNQRIATELLRMLNSIQNITVENVGENLSKVNDLLAEAVSFRIQNDQLTNVTVQALVFAYDVNKISDEYTSAFKEGNTSLNMDMHTTKDDMHSMKMDNNSMSMSTNATKMEIVTDVAAYQRAGALTDIAIERFNAELSGKSNSSSALERVVKGLDQLKVSIKNIESPVTVLGTIHGEIQPNLQIAFNLQLAPSTNHGIGNMSMSTSTNNNNNQSMEEHMMMNMN